MDLEKIKDFREKEKQNLRESQDKANQLNAIKNSGDKVASAVGKSTQVTAEGLKNIKGDVNVTNPDLARTDDISEVVDSINKMNVTTFMSNRGFTDVAENMQRLSIELQSLQKKLGPQGMAGMQEVFTTLINKLQDVAKLQASTQITVDKSLTDSINSLKKSVDKIDLKPSVNVKAPEAKVVTTPIDLKPVVSALEKVEKSVGGIKMPDTKVNLEPVIQRLNNVVDTIKNLRFPTPNYVLPFKDSEGKATQLVLNNDGTLPLGTETSTRTTDSMSSALATDVLMNDLTALTPKFAIIDAASSGNNTLVASVSGKKIRVVSLFLVSAGTVNVRFESGADGTALTGQMNLIANTGFVLPFNPVGWFETAATTLLNLELSAAQSVDGSLTYIEVT